MKKISRLTALLLAILMLSSAALATENGIEFRNFNTGDYSLMVAAAQDANAAIGKNAVTNRDGVEVRNIHYLYISYVKDWLDEGTVVKITDYKTGAVNGSWFDSYWYGVSYEKNGETKTGYIQTKYLDILEPAPEVVFTPWDGASETVVLSYSVNEAASYEWQRGLAGEDGEIVWETIQGEVGSSLAVNTDMGNLRYVYRCVAKDGSGEVVYTSDDVTLIREDLASWLSDEDITEEMLTRAMNAPSLDSLVIEGEWLVHVRTGEDIAYYNTRTNALVSAETGKVLGFVIGDVVYAPRN